MESAFGVDHGEFSKAVNPSKIGTAVKGLKPHEQLGYNPGVNPGALAGAAKKKVASNKTLQGWEKRNARFTSWRDKY